MKVEYWKGVIMEIYKRKLVFIDIDGTLLLEDQTVPQSAIDAIQEARKNNVLVFIATGRSVPEITPQFTDIGFDGYICSGGAYIIIDDEIIHNTKFSQRDAVKAIEYLMRINVDFYIETSKGIFATDTCAQTAEIMWNKYSERKGINVSFPDELKEMMSSNLIKNIDLNDVRKISFISKEVNYEFIYEYLHMDFKIIPNTVFEFGDNSGEIVNFGNDKSHAVLRVQNFYPFPTFTYAYGNGFNDIDMFKVVDHAVAMGGSPKEIIEYADELAHSPEDEGIYLSFKRNKII